MGRKGRVLDLVDSKREARVVSGGREQASRRESKKGGIKKATGESG